MICVLVYFDSFVVSTVFTWKKKTTIAMVSVNVCVRVCGGGILRESKSHFDYLNQFASDKMYSMYWHAIHYMKNSLVFFSFSRFFMLFSSVFPLVHMFSPFFLLFVVSLSAFSTFFPHFLVFLCCAPSHLSVIHPFSEFLPCSLASSEFCPLFLYFPLIPCFQNWLPPGGH